MPYTEVRRVIDGKPLRPTALALPIVVVTLGFCAICAYILIDARRAAWERASEAATSLVTAIEADIARNIEALDLSLQAVADNLKYPGIETMDPELRRLLLFDRAATAQHVRTILVLDKSGNIRIDARSILPASNNLAERDYFQFHKNNDAAGLYIGRPQIAHSTGQPFLGLSRRLSHPDGSFAGVVVGSLRLSYFKELFQKTLLGADGTITLSTVDGTVIMRWPFDASLVGLDVGRAELFKHLAKSKSGRFETYAITDGVHRLIVYSQIKNLPLVIGAGQSTH